MEIIVFKYNNQKNDMKNTYSLHLMVDPLVYVNMINIKNNGIFLPITKFRKIMKLHYLIRVWKLIGYEVSCCILNYNIFIPWVCIYYKPTYLSLMCFTISYIITNRI